MYLLWLTLFVCIPLLILWFFQFKLLIKYWKTLFYSVCGTWIISIPWDFYAVTNHIWYFPSRGISGIYFGVLPIEEYLFMAFVTLLLASITIVIKYKIKFN